MNENLEKIVAILDVLLYRIRKLKRACEKDTTQEEEAKELILKTFDGIISMIEMERNHFEDGTQTVPMDYAEDRAIGYAEYILQMSKRTFSDKIAIPARRAQVMGVITAVSEIISDLKKERGLEDVLVTQEKEIVEGTVRFSIKEFTVPDTDLTYEDCVGRIAQLEWIIANCENEGYTNQYLAGRLDEWRKMRDKLNHKIN